MAGLCPAALVSAAEPGRGPAEPAKGGAFREYVELSNHHSRDHLGAPGSRRSASARQRRGDQCLIRGFEPDGVRKLRRREFLRQVHLRSRGDFHGLLSSPDHPGDPESKKHLRSWSRRGHSRDRPGGSRDSGKARYWRRSGCSSSSGSGSSSGQPGSAELRGIWRINASRVPWKPLIGDSGAIVATDRQNTRQLSKVWAHPPGRHPLVGGWPCSWLAWLLLH